METETVRQRSIGEQFTEAMVEGRFWPRLLIVAGGIFTTAIAVTFLIFAFWFVWPVGIMLSLVYVAIIASLIWWANANV